jgi:hypothetical protein
MTRQNGARARPGSLWLLLVPVTCCGGPQLLAGLAAAGTAAWGGPRAALAAAEAGVML